MKLAILCVVEVHKYNNIGQSLWISLDNNKITIRIIYAPQESRTLKQELNEMYKDIESQISMAEEKQQKLLLIGDLNCKVGNLITGNTEQVTKGDRILMKMINKKTALSIKHR